MGSTVVHEISLDRLTAAASRRRRTGCRGAVSALTATEAIWRAAKWWHLYCADQNRTEIRGAYYVGHRLK
jgi:hypothetical protein